MPNILSLIGRNETIFGGDVNHSLDHYNES